MSTNFLIMAVLICLFDIVMLILNYTKLKFHTGLSIVRLLIGMVLAAVVLALLRSSQADFNRNMVVGAIALTIFIWGLLRKGIGEHYVFSSFSVNGLVDWRNVRSIEVEQFSNGQLTKFTMTDFMKRSRVLTLKGDAEAIRNFANNKLETLKNN